jgi:hypothetical protein
MFVVKMSKQLPMDLGPGPEKSMRKSKYLIFTLILTILPVFTTVCSPDASITFSETVAMEGKLHELIQLEPKIETAVYIYKSTAVVGAEFTWGKIKYYIACPFNMNNVSNYVFEIVTDDGKHKFIGADYGSEEGLSPYTGTLDGKIDYSQIEDHGNVQRFNRYTGNNIDQRDNFQKLFNASISKALKFFLQ